MNFEEVYNEYVLYATRRHKKQGFDTLQQNFSKHVLPYFKKYDLQDLTIDSFVYWQDKILEFNFSNNYNRNIYQAFNSFMKYCLLMNYITINYLERIGPFKKKIENKTHDVYNLFEFKKFRKGIDNIIYKYFFDFLYFYGPRSGEAMALKFSKLQHNIIHVDTNINRRDKREISSVKSINSIRNIKINIFMRFKLFILKCMYIKKYGDNEYDYFIFGGKKPLSPTSIKRYKHNACVIMDIREITTHEFRHSYATRMIRKKKPIDVVSRSLGHSSVAITLDVYVHQEKRQTSCLFLRLDFFDTLQQNFKKILQSIITHFIV